MNFLNDHLLSILMFSPLIGVVFLLLTNKESKAAIRSIAFITTAFNFAVFLLIAYQFQRNTALMQFEEYAPWIKQFGIGYHIGIDGMSFLLVFLTSLLSMICILSSWTSVTEKVKEYHIFMLLLEVGMFGVFLSVDLFLFYIFWEAMLIPMYFLIGIWGGSRRIYAAIKFFLYTMAGSVLMLVAILAMYFIHAGIPHIIAGKATFIQTFDLRIINSVVFAPHIQMWLFAAFAIAFAIKVPMFPFHTWLPDAHVEAPTAGSVILAGVLLKMGAYGFLRFAMPLFPYAAHKFMPLICTLAVIGIIYGALVAMVQPDIKKLVAYSSVSHMGFVILGMFALNTQGLEGAMLQMVNHGFSTGALFLIVGMIYERRHTRQISDFGGIAKAMPVFFVFFLVTTLASIGLPGLNGFVGEFLILVGSFTNTHLAHANYYTIAAASGVIFAAIYMLWMFQRVMYGPLDKPENIKLKDLNAREIIILIPMVAFMFWIGIYSISFRGCMSANIRDFIAVMKSKQIAVKQIPAGQNGMQWSDFSVVIDDTKAGTEKSKR